MFNRQELNKLYRYGFTLSGNRDKAYDLLHGAIESYLNKRHSDIENKTAYVKRAMRNRFIDEFRQTQKFPNETFDDNAPVSMDASALEDIVIAEHDIAIVWDMLDATEREILYYWAIEECPTSEIAERLAMPRGTVLSRIHRLRSRIKTAMNSEVGNGGYGT